MALPTSAWGGVDTNVSAAHAYIQGVNSDGSNSFGALAGGSSASFAACGLCQTISPSFEQATTDRTAENSKVPIKVVNGAKTYSFEIWAMVQTSWNKSAAHGYLADYALDVAIPASPESLTVQLKIYYMKDNEDWESASCKTAGGIWFKQARLTPMGEGTETIDGESVNVLKFKVTAEKDADGDFYTVIAYDTTIDASAEFIT